MIRKLAPDRHWLTYHNRDSTTKSVGFEQTYFPSRANYESVYRWFSSCRWYALHDHYTQCCDGNRTARLVESIAHVSYLIIQLCIRTSKWKLLVITLWSDGCGHEGSRYVLETIAEINELLHFVGVVALNTASHLNSKASHKSSLKIFMS
jgi:hypothetical protein